VALVSVLTTVLALRAGGMTLLRTPAFSWSVLVGGGLTLLTAPVLAARLIDVYIGHHFGASVPDYFPTIAWFWSVPHVYLLVVPAAGIALEVVPVLSRTRVRAHGAGMVLLGLLGVVGLGAWAQAPETFDDLLYVAIGLAAVLPALALLGLVGDTLRGGRPALGAPLLLAMGSLLLLLLGSVAGALLVIEPLELHGTVWEAGQMHLVLLGAGTLGGLAGLWYWAPKIWGVQLAQGAGLLAFAGIFLGAVLLGGADLVNGLIDDVPLAAAEFPDDGAVQSLNVVSAVGGLLAFLGAAVALLAVLGAARTRRRVTVADDPWGGHTLEWATTSPPPPANFVTPVPAVTSATPLLADPADDNGVPA
jgi:heme/copper-type cytochrome/quinol oxidase subunit 1